MSPKRAFDVILRGRKWMEIWKPSIAVPWLTFDVAAKRAQALPGPHRYEPARPHVFADFTPPDQQRLGLPQLSARQRKLRCRNRLLAIGRTLVIVEQ
jgi:hypothetical protein